jgi:hypothetical protein
LYFLYFLYFVFFLYFLYFVFFLYFFLTTTLYLNTVPSVDDVDKISSMDLWDLLMFGFPLDSACLSWYWHVYLHTFLGLLLMFEFPLASACLSWYWHVRLRWRRRQTAIDTASTDSAIGWRREISRGADRPCWWWRSRARVCWQWIQPVRASWCSSRSIARQDQRCGRAVVGCLG